HSTGPAAPRPPPPFPTRRSSDLPPQDAQAALQLHNRVWTVAARTSLENGGMLNEHHGIGLKLGRLMREQYGTAWPALDALKQTLDRKSTRLNPVTSLSRMPSSA